MCRSRKPTSRLQIQLFHWDILESELDQHHDKRPMTIKVSPNGLHKSFVIRTLAVSRSNFDLLSHKIQYFRDGNLILGCLLSLGASARLCRYACMFAHIQVLTSPSWLRNFAARYRESGTRPPNLMCHCRRRSWRNPRSSVMNFTAIDGCSTCTVTDLMA